MIVARSLSCGWTCQSMSALPCRRARRYHVVRRTGDTPGRVVGIGGRLAERTVTRLSAGYRERPPVAGCDEVGGLGDFRLQAAFVRRSCLPGIRSSFRPTHPERKATACARALPRLGQSTAEPHTHLAIVRRRVDRRRPPPEVRPPAVRVGVSKPGSGGERARRARAVRAGDSARGVRWHRLSTSSTPTSTYAGRTSRMPPSTSSATRRRGSSSATTSSAGSAARCLRSRATRSRSSSPTWTASASGSRA